MGENDVHVVQLKSLQRVFGAFNDVFTRKTWLVNSHFSVVLELFMSFNGFFISCTPEKFGWDYDFFSLDIDFFKSLSKEGFGLSESVHLSRVEIVDSMLNTTFDTRYLERKFLWVRSANVSDHISPGEDWDSETGFSKISIFHSWFTSKDEI
jgi:hypothetical protein